MADAAGDDETTRVPSLLEIVGLVACAAPFAISNPSAHWSVVNGSVTDFGYSDPVAIVAGMCGALAGIVSILVAKTVPARRNLRSLICIALLCVGGYHVARGFGVGIDPASFTNR